MSSSGIAAQFTSTKGPLLRRLAAWSERATSSLPVPLSPKIKTRPLGGAVTAICRRRAFQGAFRRFGGFGDVAFVGEDGREGLADAGFVVNDEDVRFQRHGLEKRKVRTKDKSIRVQAYVTN